ncbi:DUF1302 family protein [Roseomonas genomospecies 6]|uniref:Alginate export domain-containing protein n=1 Tax=Roseomonas genomospecies 6 TaxID=214106 RepID=A0A9W7KPS1_9PROT|nr:DUF1302 family protein [Roseomonas genomospecies 6]KAA0677157.1 hypothetical protein DS843_24510 [Roseomonas genomospecies 6]
MRLRWTARVFAVAVCAGATLAQATEPAEAPLASATLDTSLRAGFWSSSRSLDERRGIGTANVWLRTAADLSESVRVKAEGWAATPRIAGDDRWKGELREAHVTWSGADLDLRAGRQIVVWGRADQINPTSHLASRDYTLLFAEDDDQRRGVAMLRANRYHGDWTFGAYWVPEFRPNVFPRPLLPAGVSYADDDQPDGVRQFGVKLDRSGGAVDWSVSVFDGWDDNPDTAVVSAGPGGVVLQRRHHRIRSLGADAATTVGSYGLRAEAAYVFTENAGGTDPFVRPPSFGLVVGGDRNLFGNTNVSIQYVLLHTRNFRDPRSEPIPYVRAAAVQTALDGNQINRTQMGATLKLTSKWLNDTLEGDVTGVLYKPDGDWLLSTRLRYAFSDAWKGIVGAEWHGGQPDSYFGRLRENNLVFVEVRRGF